MPVFAILALNMSTLILADGTTYEGKAFGAPLDSNSLMGEGEVVFNTGMSGYPESLTDPSYRGQILVFTYPLIGNYGVPGEELNEFGFSKNLESEEIQVRGVIVTEVSEDHSHYQSASSLHNWLEHHGVPGITGVDTRALTKKLREHGVMLGHFSNQDDASYTAVTDPNESNLVGEVSCKEVHEYQLPDTSGPTIIAYDCGMKRNIIRSFLNRGVKVVRVPWDFDLDAYDGDYDAVFVSNGPGDPKMCKETIAQIQKSIEKNIPTFGICLGNQLLALAIGGDTFKLKYGHRGANQPCIEHDKDGNPTDKCIITSQNHGFAVSDELPTGWKTWFTNANDGTVEGIAHESGKFFSVQFHPEAFPGPEDAAYLFDAFLDVV